MFKDFIKAKDSIKIIKRKAPKMDKEKEAKLKGDKDEKNNS